MSRHHIRPSGSGWLWQVVSAGRVVALGFAFTYARALEAATRAG